MFLRTAIWLFVVALFSGSAFAGPISGSIMNGDLRSNLANEAIVKVRGCHSRQQTHYMPRLNRSAPHYHVGRRCRPVVRRPVRRNCHRNWERHSHRGVRRSDRFSAHRHVGRRCSPVYRRSVREHCHRGWSKHFHRELGWRKYHRHVGRSCAARSGRTYRGPRRRGYRDCTRIGPIWVCK